MKFYKHVIQIYKNFSIRQKLLLLFSIQIIIPILFMGIMLYRTTENIVTNKSITYAMDLVKMIELRLEDFDREIKAGTHDFLYNQELYEWLTDDEALPIEHYQMSNNVRSLLRRINLSKDVIQSIAVVNNDGEIVSYDTNTQKAVIGYVMPYDAIRANANAAAGLAAWYFEVNENKEVERIYLTRAIYDIATHEEIGLVVVLIKQEQVQNIYSELSTEFMNKIMIFSENREVITAENPIEQEVLNEHIFNDELLSSGYYLSEEDGTLLTHQLVESNGWLVVSEVSLKNLNRDLEGFKYILVLITILTLLILSVFTILMAIDILDPINRLVSSIKLMQENNKYEAVLVDRKDELGYLSECFNNMSQEIDVLLNEVYREHLTRKEAELKALQAQINPHFLFNTLESINWLAQMNAAPEISDMVTALSSLMEASIGKGTSLIPLSDEIHHAESYILIMKNRYGDRLLFKKEVDPRMMSVRIPKLTLQPIIENAIYHGIDKVRKGGTIALTVEKYKETCRIIIEDNGKGMSNSDAVKMNDTFRRASDAYLTQEGKNSIGLINVNHRIKLYCGASYGVQIKSWLDHGTKVTVTIPLTIQ